MSNQPELFNTRISQHGAPVFKPHPIKTMVRADDPSTSYRAAESVVGKEAERRKVILDAFRDGGSMTHPELIIYLYHHGYYWKDSSIRGVCARMVQAGTVKDTLDRKDGHIVWGLA